MDNKNKIYTMWWQGFDRAPDIVKICHNSLLRHHNPDTQDVISLDAGNYLDYVKLPDYILQKVESGIISLTHLSDIIRAHMLHEMGGCWCDATMLFFKDIEDTEFFEPDFFSKRDPGACERDLYSRWAGFFMAGKKGFPLFKLLVDFFNEYWKREDELITYLLIDHILYIGYNNNGEVKKAIDQCRSFFHYRVGYVQSILNHAYEDGRYHEIMRNDPYIKMSWKSELKEHTEDGELTFYGHLRREFL